MWTLVDARAAPGALTSVNRSADSRYTQFCLVSITYRLRLHTMDDELEWEDVFFDGDFFVDDQRDTERHGVRVKVAYAHDSEQYKAYSNDISHGGLFIATSEPLAQDTEFKLVFQLPTGDEPIRAIGRVAWIRSEAGEDPEEPPGFGVEFLKIADAARAEIEQFLELRSAMLFDDPGQ